MDASEHLIDSQSITLEQIGEILSSGKKLTLSEASRNKVASCRDFLDQKLQQLEAPIYGVNTGFGSLCNTIISDNDLGKLQKNLVVSHACGTGNELDSDIVRIMLLLKIQGLSYGHSGVQVSTIQRLIDFYNEGIYPVVYELGSLGASGDLAPLAHISLALIGLGEVWYQGEKQKASAVLDKKGWQPLVLQSKEGLALLNGTQFMSAHGVHCLLKAKKLSRWADVLAALSLEGFDGRPEPFNPLIHQVRPHKGQQETAANLRRLLEGSELISRPKSHVQDPYSFRCVPQVHGATKDMLRHVKGVVECEVNAVTDNPTIFPEEGLVISAGNFHGQPLAISFDAMAIAMAELGSISERRTYKLISGERGLPAFLVATPGLDSGFMIPQYTAASIVSQNKQLCTPASVDTIDSSQGQEDHVSMGANAATKLLRVVQNLERIMAIEIFNAAQAIEFRRPAKTSPRLEKLVQAYREKVQFVENDKVMFEEMHRSEDFIRSFDPHSI